MKKRWFVEDFPIYEYSEENENTGFRINQTNLDTEILCEDDNPTGKDNNRVEYSNEEIKEFYMMTYVKNHSKYLVPKYIFDQIFEDIQFLLEINNQNLSKCKSLMLNKKI